MQIVFFLPLLFFTSDHGSGMWLQLGRGGRPASRAARQTGQSSSLLSFMICGTGGLPDFFELANHFRICFRCSNMYKNKAPAIKAMISSRNIGFILAVYLPFPWTTRHLIIPQNYLQPIVVVPGFERRNAEREPAFPANLTPETWMKKTQQLADVCS